MKWRERVRDIRACSTTWGWWWWWWYKTRKNQIFCLNFKADEAYKKVCDEYKIWGRLRSFRTTLVYVYKIKLFSHLFLVISSIIFSVILFNLVLLLFFGYLFPFFFHLVFFLVIITHLHLDFTLILFHELFHEIFRSLFPHSYDFMIFFLIFTICCSLPRVCFFLFYRSLSTQLNISIK